MDNLKDFILAEMNKRGLSEREFSRLVGVAHTTINYLTNQDKNRPREVTVPFIIKLAPYVICQRVGVDICYCL